MLSRLEVEAYLGIERIANETCNNDYIISSISRANDLAPQLAKDWLRMREALEQLKRVRGQALSFPLVYEDFVQRVVHKALADIDAKDGETE